MGFIGVWGCFSLQILSIFRKFEEYFNFNCIFNFFKGLLMWNFENFKHSIKIQILNVYAHEKLSKSI